MTDNEIKEEIISLIRKGHSPWTHTADKIMELTKRHQDNNICECGHPKSAHIYESGFCRTGKVACYCTNYKAKFGKDNSGITSCSCPIDMPCDCGYDHDLSKKLSQQPPKEQADTCNCHIDDDDGNINYCEKHEPKERKVSLEEISKILICLHEVTGEVYLGNITGTSQSILSLLNATEERKGE